MHTPYEKMVTARELLRKQLVELLHEKERIEQGIFNIKTAIHDITIKIEEQRVREIRQMGGV